MAARVPAATRMPATIGVTEIPLAPLVGVKRLWRGATGVGLGVGVWTGTPMGAGGGGGGLGAGADPPSGERTPSSVNGRE